MNNETREKAERYWAAKEAEKRREQRNRDAAILRAMNADSEKYHTAMTRLSVSRATLIVATLMIFYTAARGWGIM